MIPSRTPPMPTDLRVRLLAELRALVSAAGERGWSDYRVDQAATVWSRQVPAPTDVLDLVAEVREPRLGARRSDALRRVEHVAVAAIAQRLVREALTDGLTGLATRARLEDEVQHMMAMAARSGAPLTAVMIDLVGLKQINDQQGHQAGDDAIAEAGRAIRANVRRSDRAFRWGGDEFALFMAGSTAEDALEVVGRIRAGSRTQLSAGVATHSGAADDTDIVAWLARADADLYARRQQERAPLGARVPVPAPARRPRLAGLLLPLVATATASTVGWFGATNAASTFQQPAAPATTSVSPGAEVPGAVTTSRPATVRVPALGATPRPTATQAGQQPTAGLASAGPVATLAPSQVPELPLPVVLPTATPATPLPVPPGPTEPPRVVRRAVGGLLDGPPTPAG